jgi:RNA polymerase sigma factor (sigma-70 family)
MIRFTDEAIIHGLKEKNIRCITYLYREFFPLARSIVEHNSGSYQDAEDLFQDGLVVLYLKAKDGGIRLNCSLKTFFYSVCRNIWLQRLDRKWRLLFCEDMVSEEADDYTVSQRDIDEERLERTRLYQVHFLSLPVDCQMLLRMFIQKKTLKEIREKLGLRTDKYTKTRKYLCKNLLRKRILGDPKCQHLLHYD